MTEILTTTSQQPITFYGKVIDQHGDPVVGAEVRGNVSISQAWMDQKWDEHFTTTDGSGLFQFAGLRGQELVVSPKKDGYEYKSNNAVFAYSSLTPDKERHRPDPAAPVVFKMWKQQGAEPLITGNKFFGITPNGTPFTIDLKNGRKNEGRQTEGDFVVSIKQPPQITDGSRFDWSFTIDAIDGGLLEVTDTQYPNEAPAAGYQLQISQELRASDPEWRDVVRKTLFVKSRNGNQFARASVEIRANYQGAAAFSVHYFVNPSPGSRNLEYDPSKQAAAR
ncbi:MAG: carboxypeptidase-like regulatory domain-containing protein [Chthoniobacterales bacterium]